MGEINPDPGTPGGGFEGEKHYEKEGDHNHESVNKVQMLNQFHNAYHLLILLIINKHIELM